MARYGPINAPGALHHIIIRGIERKAMFRDDFLECSGNLLPETTTACCAWARLQTHAHFLVRTGEVTEREGGYQLYPPGGLPRESFTFLPAPLPLDRAT
jgi:hypothetical protein